MQTEFTTMLHMIIYIFCFISLLSFIMYYVSVVEKQVEYKFIGDIFSFALDYSKSMKIENYRAYEKYQIWRFSTLF